MRLINTKVVLRDGQGKKTAKTFYVSAETFTEAERVVADALGAEIEEVKAMSFVSYSDFKDYGGESFFKVVSELVTLNEVTGKEMRTRIATLVRGESVEKVTEECKGWMDFNEEIAAVTRLNIEDIIWIEKD